MFLPSTIAKSFLFVYNPNMTVRDDEKVKQLIAANIAYYRKECHLTQAELAEKIHYSDKSVSKWERAEGLPDICVLVVLADMFGVTVNDLLAEKHRKSRRTAPKMHKGLITMISILLVWLVAVVVFFAMKVFLPDFKWSWLSFIYAIPVSFIVGTVLSALWHPKAIQFIMQSGIVWGIALALHLSIHARNMFLVYVVAAVLELLLILWFFLRKVPLISAVRNKGIKRKKQKSPEEQPSENNEQ